MSPTSCRCSTPPAYGSRSNRIRSNAWTRQDVRQHGDPRRAAVWTSSYPQPRFQAGWCTGRAQGRTLLGAWNSRRGIGFPGQNLPSGWSVRPIWLPLCRVDQPDWNRDQHRLRRPIGDPQLVSRPGVTHLSGRDQPGGERSAARPWRPRRPRFDPAERGAPDVDRPGIEPAPPFRWREVGQAGGLAEHRELTERDFPGEMRQR